MTRRLIISGSRFEAEIGYSRAVVDGEWVFVSGTTGFDYAAMTISDDVVEQCEQTLKNIVAALAQADATLADVVRVNYILPQREDFPVCWPVLRKYLGDVRPAATMIQAGLADGRMKIEIEVTARRAGRWRAGVGVRGREVGMASLQFRFREGAGRFCLGYCSKSQPQTDGRPGD